MTFSPLFSDMFTFVVATMIAAQTIQSGTNDIVVSGGMESMSNVPKYLPQARSDFWFY